MRRHAWGCALIIWATSSLAGECRTERFETRLVRDACAQDGQEGARAAMKRFQREARARQRELECRTCHASLMPDYPLEKRALERFRSLGGE